MRHVRTVALTTALVIALPMTAWAGGWAITMFEQLPASFEAGETYQLTYTVLQHGVTPAEGQMTSVFFTDTITGETVRFAGTPTGEPGQYAAEVTIPSSGSWQWAVDQGDFGPYEMGPLSVVSASASQPLPATGAYSSLLRVLLPMATLAAAVMMAWQIAELRRRRQPV